MSGVQGYNWIASTKHDALPPSAVVGGRDSDGSILYVGRAEHKGGLLPAKLVPERKNAYVCCKGKEHKKKEYDVLCEQRFNWLPSSDGQVPMGAVEGGRTCDGELLYIGRVYHENSHTVGKIHPSHGCLYIPYGGQEVRYNENYEILCML